MSNLLGSLVALFSLLFCGFLIQAGTSPSFVNWVSYASPLNHAFKMLMINELNGESILFAPKGYKVKVEVNGEMYYKQLGMHTDDFMPSFSALCGACTFFFLLSYVLLYFCVKERR